MVNRSGDELTDFDITGLSNYQMYELHMIGVFQIPDALSEDTVRISVEHGDGLTCSRPSHTPKATWITSTTPPTVSTSRV